jgi:hypothetical protein
LEYPGCALAKGQGQSLAVTGLPKRFYRQNLPVGYQR